MDSQNNSGSCVAGDQKHKSSLGGYPTAGYSVFRESTANYQLFPGVFVRTDYSKYLVVSPTKKGSFGNQN